MCSSKKFFFSDKIIILHFWKGVLFNLLGCVTVSTSDTESKMSLNI